MNIPDKKSMTVRFQSITALNSAVSELKFCKTVSVGISEIKYNSYDHGLKSHQNVRKP